MTSKTTKKITGVQNLRKRIRTIVKEEVRAALREEVSPWFKKVRNKKAFAAWIMRQYFNPEKHGDKIWFDDSVTVDNALEYVTKMGENGVFPQSPKALSELWKLKGQLTSAIGAMDKSGELDAAVEDEEEAEEKVTYQTGEVSLKDIGAELGGVTPTMVNKLAASGMEKFRAITGGKPLRDLDSDELEAFLKKIHDARLTAVEEFTSELLAAKSVADFLKGLAKRQILSPTDLKLITKSELDGLQVLREKDPERIKLILLQDIQDANNIFKSFQAAVSKKVFPPKKRGRPKKKRD